MPGQADDSPRGGVALREVHARDVPILYQHQLDAEANRMAGTKPRSAGAFSAVWERTILDPAVVARVIVTGDLVVGAISCFKMDGLDAVGYWIAREHWGKGVATQALALFLREVARRPLHASAACENAASIRVLERCGFRPTGVHLGAETDRYVAGEVATFVLR